MCELRYSTPLPGKPGAVDCPDGVDSITGTKQILGAPSR
jgi:hypothetical protein